MKRTAREASAWPHMGMSGNSVSVLSSLRPRIYPGWLVVAAAFCGVMVSFGSLLVFTFGIFLKPLSTEFGWSRESISTAFGIAAMTVAVCSPVLGRLLDRYGARPVVLCCMAVFGLGLRIALISDSKPASSLCDFFRSGSSGERDYTDGLLARRVKLVY
jgi:MFS family permease